MPDQEQNKQEQDSEKKKKKRITLYSHKDCPPCELIMKRIQEGNVDAGEAEELETVDIDSDEGFDRFQKEVLEKLPEGAESPLPGAYMDGQLCKIALVDEDKYVIFECPAKESSEEKPAE